MFGALTIQPALPARSGVVCSVGRSYSSIPKLEPFSRTRLQRRVKDLPFLRKTENELTDYCTTLEGDESHSCWRAYFELKHLEKAMPKEDVEKLVRQTTGVKSLIDSVRSITAIENRYKNEDRKPITLSSDPQKETPFHVPDGLPKTEKELEEEEKARMPDSPFTTMLRSMGRYPAWYTQAPDHETY